MSDHDETDACPPREHAFDAKLRRFATDLAAHVDVEAGLREVLRTPPYDDPSGTTADVDGAAAVVAYVSAQQPDRRVRLRAHPVLRTCALASVSLEARTVSDDIRFTLMVSHGSGDLSEVPVVLGRTLIPGLRRTRAGTLGAALDAAGASVGDHAGLLALAADLDRAVRGPRAGFRALVGIPDRLSYYAKTTQAVFVREMDRALERGEAGHDDRFAVALRALPDEHRAATVCWLRRHLDDLRGADLSAADLGGVPLAGARWSVRTRWPSGWAAWVARHSAPVEDVPGEFVVRG